MKREEKDDGTAPKREIPPLLVTREEAANALSLGVSTFMREVRAGRIPVARAVSPGRVAWLWSELEAFAAALPLSKLLPPPNSANRRQPVPSILRRSKGPTDGGR